MLLLTCSTISQNKMPFTYMKGIFILTKIVLTYFSFLNASI
jgi:hypothetical protein